MYQAHLDRLSRIRRAGVVGLILGAGDSSSEGDGSSSDTESMLLAVAFMKAASRRNHAKRLKFTRVTDTQLLARDDVLFYEQMRYKKSTVRVLGCMRAGT